MTGMDAGRLRGWILILAAAPFAALGALVVMTGAAGREPGSVPLLMDGTVLMGIVLFLAPLSIAGAFAAASARRRRDGELLLRNGMRGTATAAVPAHPAVMTGCGPLLGIEMEIALPGMRPYMPPYRRIFRVSPDVAAKVLLHPGEVFEAVADPQNPRRVVIDWTAGHGEAPSGVRASSVSRGPAKGRPSELRPAVLVCR